METSGLAACCGLAGKPGGERGVERGGDRGAWRGARGGGVRGHSAAGTEGAGEVAAGAGVLSPVSWAAILVPATHSVSRFLARSRITFALIWNAPEDMPSWMHCTVRLTLPRILILKPEKENF